MPSLEHLSYSGKVQAWFHCGLDDVTNYKVAAAPEGRDRVVSLRLRTVVVANVEVGGSIFGPFEVDCGRTKGASPRRRHHVSLSDRACQ